MKAIKLYLAVVTTLLVLALAAGVYVWFVVQDTQSKLDESTVQEASDIPEGDTPVITDTTQPPREPVTIEVETLPENQQKVLQTFGFEGQTFTITEAMMVCAENAVGKERFDVIIGGMSPSPLESLKLLPCFKK